MSTSSPCTRCGGDAGADRERVALSGICPRCLARDLQDPTPVPFQLREQPENEPLGPFRLLKKLGEGGMGSVYLGEDTRNGRKVAVKVLPRRSRGADPDALARFRREAAAAMKLSHPNLVRATAAGEARGYPYYAMEHLEGESLDR